MSLDNIEPQADVSPEPSTEIVEDSVNTELSTQEEGNEENHQVSSNVEESSVTDEPTGWEADKRYKEMWKEDPNKLYDYTRSLEKRQGEFETASKEAEEFKEKLSALNDYQENVESILNHEQLGPKIQEILSDYQSQLDREKYGEDLTTQQIQYQKTLDEKIERLEAKEKEQQLNEAFNRQYEVAKEQFNRIDSIANEIGVNWDDEQQAAFAEHCKENGVPVGMLESEFMRHALPYFKKHYQGLGEKNAIENKQKAREMSISGSGNKREEASSGNNWKELVSNILGE